MKGYENCTDDEIIIRSLNEFKLIEQLYQDTEQFKDKMENQINKCLTKTPIDWDGLKQIMSTINFNKLEMISDSLNKFVVLINVMEKELVLGLPSSFAECNNIEDYAILYQQIVFCLRRIDLKYVTLTEKNYNILNKLSFVCVGFLIQKGRIINKSEVSIKVADYYIKNNRRNDAIYLLFMMSDLLKPDNIVIVKFSDFLFDMDEIEYGKTMLLKVQE